MEFENHFKNDKLMKIIRETVLSIYPEAQERISYGMPAWFVEKNVLLYARAYEKHIGLYPKPAFISSHSAELTQKYKYSKGAIKIPKDIEINDLKKLVTNIIKWNMEYAEHG